MQKNSPQEQLQWLEFDRRHIWRPYAPLPNPIESYPVVAAKGARIQLADGRWVIDGMSSWWSVIHGYRHPDLDRAARKQLKRMAHVMFGGLAHQPAAELGKNLLDIVPQGLKSIFFCDSGSVAVEVAIKMALQYWIARNESKKKRMLTVRGGYHGDTLGAMSLCDPLNGMHALFQGALPKQFFAPLPEPRFGEPFEAVKHGKALRVLFERHASHIAAMIIEPVVQGAGGMRFYAPQYLCYAKQLCDQHGVLLIVDEIATGFGRSGKLFASEYARLQPDILCLGKALTGGYVSFAATLCTSEISDTIAESNYPALMHGPTYMGNPLACAIANASLKLLLTSSWQERVSSIEKELKSYLEPLKTLNGVKDVRVLGAIGVVEMSQTIDIAQAQKMLLERGVWLRPFGKLLYTMPPYMISKAQIKRLGVAIQDCASQLSAS